MVQIAQLLQLSKYCGIVPYLKQEVIGSYLPGGGHERALARLALACALGRKLTEGCLGISQVGTPLLLQRNR